MAGGLEEPILSTLGQSNDLGATFMNAFYKAAALNNQKQTLEKQMMALNADMAYKREAHDLDRQQFAWKQKVDMANLSREADAQQALATYRDRTASRLEDKFTWDLSRKDAEQENASQYQDALTSLIQKYPDTYSNQEFLNELSLVQGKFNTVAGTPSGKRVTDVFDRQIKASVDQAHKNADVIRKNLEFSLAAQDRGGQGLNRTDLNRPEDAFFDKDGKKMIAEYPVMVPGSTTVSQWNTISPKELGDLSSEDQQSKWPGMRIRSSPSSSWQSTKKLYESYSKIGGQDLNDKPGFIPPQTGGHNVGDTVRLKNGQVVTIQSINQDGTFSY